MDDDDRGWPLEKEAIRAKYNDLVQREQVLLAHDPALSTLPGNLVKSVSTREAYSRARGLRRGLGLAGWADWSGKSSQSVPASTPSSVSGPSLSPRRSRLKNCAVGSLEEVLEPLADDVFNRATPKLKKTGTQTKFLAKQFKLITNNANATPRRNINILAKAPSEATKVMVVAEKKERDELQERIRVHDSDQFDPSNLAALSLRLDSLSRSPGRRKRMSYSYGGRAHANSPSSVISDVSVPETVISSVENESWIHCNLSSFTRERWTSREIFGSFDFGGELDIAASVEEAAHPDSYGHFEHDRLNSCPDESLISPSSGMRSPRPSLCTSSPGGDDHHHNRCREEPCGVPSQRVKVTSPSSLFRDGPCTDRVVQPPSSPTIPRQLSRKLSTSFTRRRTLTNTSPRHPHPASLSTRSPDQREAFSSSAGKVTLQIAGLVSGYRRTTRAARNGDGDGAVQAAAVTSFQEEIAQLMLDRQESSSEIGDIEEFLEGYMRLRSPIYLDVVEDFFRTVSFDCYRRRPQEAGKKTKALKLPKVPKRLRHGQLAVVPRRSGL